MLNQIVTAVVGLIVILYLWVRKKFNFFKSHGIPEDPGYFPLGSQSSWQLLTGKIAFTRITDRVYTEFPNEKFVGMYGPFGVPTLVIRDLDLAKHVLIKDFDHFVDRRQLEVSKKANKYLTNTLTLLNGEKWKTMRNIISPVFSSGKLRNMMPVIHSVGDEFVEYLEPFSKNGSEFECKDMMTTYTLEVIANAGLGVKANAISDPNSIFRQKVDIVMGRKKDPTNFIRMMTIFMFPKIAKVLNIAFSDPEATEFLVNVVRSSIQIRKHEESRKNDMIDILLDALNDFQKSSNDEKNSKNIAFSKEELDNVIISNALMLFFAGFDTSSAGMALVCYFLADNPVCQEQLYREISEAIAQNNGDQKLDYETVQSLPYLDKVVNESLRLYPLTIIERLCIKDYNLPGTSFVIPKGMMVQVCSPLIMKDEKYFPNPNNFDPENFSPENKANRNPYAFFAFGQGPRNCVGMRFALLQVKTAIIRLVANYKLLRCSKTVDELIPDPTSRTFMPKGGIWVKIEKRN